MIMDNEKLDPRITAGLAQLPLAELPAGLVPAIMGQVRQSRRPAPPFDFRRYAVPAFLFTFVAGLVAMCAWWLSLVKPEDAANLLTTLSPQIETIPFALVLAMLASLILCVLFMYTGFLSYFFLTSESG